jgi:hypothetical protein
MELSAVAIVAVLLSVGLVEAFITGAKKFGLAGAWVYPYALVVGVLLALVAKWAFPDAVATFTYPQVGIFGALNGLATTGLWAFRRGEAKVVIDSGDDVAG